LAVDRSWLHHQLAPEAWRGHGLSPVNRIFLAIVLLSIVAAIVQTEPTIGGAHPVPFLLLNTIFAALYTGEYALRLWSVGAAKEYRGLRGAARYALTVLSVVDLLAAIALWLDVALGVPGIYGALLRLVRVLRVLTLTRRSDTGSAKRIPVHAVRSRAVELMLSLGLAGQVLLVSSTLLYAVEGHDQPEAFGSIPRAMWWAVVTLTTVGYGDVHPLTTIGKVLAGLTAITSIAIIALPAGILAAAFSDAFQELRHKSEEHGEGHESLHEGKHHGPH
jgi:voltage-gated potassium channel